MSKIRKMIQEGKKPIGTFYDLGGQIRHGMHCTFRHRLYHH